MSVKIEEDDRSERTRALLAVWAWLSGSAALGLLALGVFSWLRPPVDWPMAAALAAVTLESALQAFAAHAYTKRWRSGRACITGAALANVAKGIAAPLVMLGILLWTGTGATELAVFALPALVCWGWAALWLGFLRRLARRSRSTLRGG